MRGWRYPAVGTFAIHGAQQGDDDARHYMHLFADDHADEMGALGAMASPKPSAGNVIPLRA